MNNKIPIIILLALLISSCAPQQVTVTSQATTTMAAAAASTVTAAPTEVIASATPTESPTAMPTPTEVAPKDGDIVNGNVYKEFPIGNIAEISGFFVPHGKFTLVTSPSGPYPEHAVFKEMYYLEGLPGSQFRHAEKPKSTFGGALVAMMVKRVKDSVPRLEAYDQVKAGTLHIPFTDALGVDRVYINGRGDRTYVIPWSATEGIDAFTEWKDPWGASYRSFVTTDKNHALITIMAIQFSGTMTPEQQKIPALFGIASILEDPTQKDIGFTQKLSTLIYAADTIDVSQ